MQTPLIAPSILSADFMKLGLEIQAVLDAGATLIHFDVMDNHFVPNLTLGPCVLTSMRAAGITADIDVHLMVTPVDALIPAFAKAGATYLSFHPEATPNVAHTLALMKSHGVKPALALNPDSPLDLAIPYLAEIDMLLLMSVHPGFGGQSFIPHVLEKARAARMLIDTLKKPIRLEMDGGIKLENIKEIAQAGVDTFVAGSAIFHSDNYAQTLSLMMQSIKSGHTTQTFNGTAV